MVFTSKDTNKFMDNGHVAIPSIYTVIDNSAFEGCSGLTSIEIPNSVTRIGSGAFEGCSGLTSIEIPNSVTDIENYAFSGCTGLTSIEIPNSVTWIGFNAFSGCSGLRAIVVSPQNPTYRSENNCCIERSSEVLILGCQDSIIPNSVTKIGDYAFCYCSGLTSIEIPNSVTEIGRYAFEGCSGLTSIVFHSNHEDPSEVEYEINQLLSYNYPLTVYVPIGCGYAYRHYPFSRPIDEVILEREAL